MHRNAGSWRLGPGRRGLSSTGDPHHDCEYDGCEEAAVHGGDEWFERTERECGRDVCGTKR